MTISPFASDDWFAVGGSEGLPPGAVMPATILGKELVVWRDRQGEAHAWPNRCAHRGMRLSMGFVDDDGLACRYHGWRYGAEGRCVRVPAHPGFEPPETFCVAPYASAEHCGMIWASTDAPRDATPSLPDPDALAGTVHFCRSLAVDVAPGRVVELAGRALFPPFGAHSAGEGNADVAHSANAPMSGVVTVDADFETGRETLIVAIQPAASDHTQVHVAVAAEVPDDQVATLRRHYTAWCRRWRWFVENDGVETTSRSALAG